MIGPRAMPTPDVAAHRPTARLRYLEPSKMTMIDDNVAG